MDCILEGARTFFKSLISKGGLKATRQREEILNIFLNSSGHKNLSQIYAQVAKVNPKIGRPAMIGKKIRNQKNRPANYEKFSAF